MAKTIQRNEERVWGYGGTHALDLIHARQPTPGHYIDRVGKRWCFKCQTDQPQKGGKLRGGSMWTCATCNGGKT